MNILTPQLQFLLSQIGSDPCFDTGTGTLDITIDAITDAVLCLTINRETVGKIEDFTDNEMTDGSIKHFQGNIGITISDDDLKLYWYSPLLEELPVYCNDPDNCLYLIKLEDGTLKKFGEAIQKMAAYHFSLRESEQFQKDAYRYILEDN